MLSNKSKEIILHIGLPKTGSSFLQNCVFPSMCDVHIVGRGGSVTSPLHFVYEDFINLRKNDVEVTEKKIKRVEKALSEITEKKIIITYEGFSGSAFVDTDKLAFDKYCEYINRMFTSFNILVFIRRQDQLLRSFYMQRVKKGYYRSVEHFLSYKAGVFGTERYVPFDSSKFGKLPPMLVDNNAIKMNVFDLDYSQFIKKLEQIKNLDKLLLFSYEEFLEDGSRIYNSLGIDESKITKKYRVNESNSNIIFMLGRLANFIHINFFRYLGLCLGNPNIFYLLHRKIISVQMSIFGRLDKVLKNLNLYKIPNVMSRELTEAIISIHLKSNRELSDKYKLHLERYGYFSKK